MSVLIELCLLRDINIHNLKRSVTLNREIESRSTRTNPKKMFMVYDNLIHINTVENATNTRIYF